MIVSFRDKRTREFAGGNRGKAFTEFERKAEMRLDQLDAATSLLDLNLPGNRLETLKGDRKGQYSIRINDQWRICFQWPKGSAGPVNVEIVDYH
ncbi:plasmid maintenance system killer protein [bacterium]|nr:MAG: plasmid maintenance system killer protein [bacterium]